MGKFLGIDYGSKRIGLALSDEEGKVAFPKTILENNSQLVEKLASFIKENDVLGIVMGESLTSTGAENEIMADVRKFAGRLGGETGLPVFSKRNFLLQLKQGGIKSIPKWTTARRL